METENAVYFYGHVNVYGFMSNFYKCNFKDNIQTYMSSEQFMMYHKCMLFDASNVALLHRIMQSKQCAEIKKCGRQVRNFDPGVWEQHREDIMYAGLMLKFEQNPSIYAKLLATKNKMLYEASHYDHIWGIEMTADVAVKSNPSRYGLNLLGKSLMKVRQTLIDKDNISIN
jgi:ribA/ribD-fused uncharacterized protein